MLSLMHAAQTRHALRVTLRENVNDVAAKEVSDAVTVQAVAALDQFVEGLGVRKVPQARRSINLSLRRAL